jgi:hypothetical protein
VTGGEGPRGAVALQAARRPESGFQPLVVCLDRVVLILPGEVQRRGDQCVEHPRVGLRTVGRDLDRDRPGAQRTGEEAPVAARSRRMDRGTSMTWPC